MGVKTRGMARCLAVASAAVLTLGASNAYANNIIDLTTQNSTSGVLTSASGDLFLVNEIDAQSTGTGLVDPFLRIQQTGSEGG